MIGSVGQQIPVVHALAAAVAANDLSNQQFATEQVMDCQRGGPTLPAGRVGGGPVIGVDGVAGVERPRLAYRGVEAFERYVSHAQILPLAIRRCPSISAELT